MAKRALQLDDLFAIGIVSDPQISPDGAHVAWVQTALDEEEDSYTSAIWIANMDGKNPRKLTSGSARDSSPVWSPDSASVAFVSNRAAPRKPFDIPDPEAERNRKKGKKYNTPEQKPLPQIWVIDIAGGEARQITNHPGGAGSPAWSPDGATIAFTAADKVTVNHGFEAPVTVGTYADERVINDIRYRFDGRGWLLTFSHVWLAEVATGELTQVTHGDQNDAGPAFSPDGKTLAFTRSPRATKATPRSSTIYLLDLASSDLRTVLPEYGSFGDPVFSPDGSRIAYWDGGDPAILGLNTHLGIVNIDGSNQQTLDGGLDRSLGDAGMSDVAGASSGKPRWMSDHEIALLISSNGETQVHVLNLNHNTLQQITSGKKRVMGYDRRGDITFQVFSEIHSPTDLYRQQGESVVNVSNTNTSWRDEVGATEAIDLNVTAPDGKPIQAWLLKPFGLDESKAASHPLILQIHGGPHAMYSYAMFHEMQWMAAKGYAVVFCNPRGSSGYGEDFTTCTRGIWGEADMPDVMAAVDAALEYSWIDGTRLGITGGSYGGYLTNWIIGHTNRFQAAVTQRCVSNLHSFFGTSDIGFDFGVFESNGTPWANTDVLLKHSPIAYVDNIETPLLIIHSEQDLRCPVEQAEQMFASLRYLGQEVKFVRIPDESHELSRSGTPSRRLARLRHMLDWFDTHLGMES